MSSFWKMPGRTTLLTALLVALIGVGSGFALRSVAPSHWWPGSNTEVEDDWGSAMRVPSPQTVQELVGWPDAIVVGTISRQLESRAEGAFNPDTGEFEVIESAPGEPWGGLPTTYYEIAIEEVLLDDGFVRASPILRLGGFPSEVVVHPAIGDRLMFVLGRNSGDTNYGVVGDWDFLRLDEETVKDFRGRPVEFARDVRLDAFLADLHAAIAERIAASPAN